MARGRMIDKVIILSRKINAVSEGAENLYYRLNVCADDFGRYHADPEIIKGQIYTRRSISTTVIKNRLKELWDTKLIRLYEIDDETYIEIAEFAKHQKLRSDIQPKAICPEPKNYLQRVNKEKKGDLPGDAAAQRLEDLEEEFEQFWEYYKSIGNPTDDIGSKERAKAAYRTLRKKISKKEIADAANGEANYLKYKRLEENFSQRKKFASTWLKSNQWKEHQDFEYKARL